MAVLGGGAPGAEGATVSVGRACYGEGDNIAVTASGLSQGPTVLALLRGPTTLVEDYSPVADAQGRLLGDYQLDSETGWFSPRETQFPMRLVLLDQRAPANLAWTDFLFSRWNVLVNGVPLGDVPLTRSTTLKAVGWTYGVGRTLYAHYLLHGRRRHTERLGLLQGPCGDVTRALPRGFPFRPVPRGSWKVRFSISKTDPDYNSPITLDGPTLSRTLRR